MLTLTPIANAALEAILESPEAPDGASVRLARGAGSDGQPSIGLMIVQDVDTADEHIENPTGVDVYVAPDAAEELDDQVLDAEIAEDHVAFSLHPQDIDGSAPPG